MAEEKKDNTYYIIVASAAILMIGFVMAMNSWREENEENVAGEFSAEASDPAAAFANIKNLNNVVE